MKLAEEARNSEVVDNRPSGMSIAHSQRSGRTGRTMITEIESSFPGSGSEDSRSSRTSTEVIPNLNIVKPVIRLGPVGHLKDTAQPMMAGNTTNSRRISPPGPVGQNIRRMGYMNVMAKPDPVGPYEDRDISVSPVTDGPAGLVRTRRPVGPYEDRDISVSPVTDGPAGLVRTRRPVGPYEDRDISVSPVTDGPAGLVRTRRPVGPYEDRDISVSPVTDGLAGLVRTRRPVGPYEDRDISVSPVTDGPAGLVRTRRPVGPYEDRDISVSPEISEGQAGHHIQPVTDGPAGLVRTRRPVGDVMLPALQDGVRPSAGGLVGQVPDPCVRSNPTRSESAMDTELLPPVIKAEGEVLRGRVRPSVVMEKTEPSEVKCSPGVQVNTAEGSSVSPSVNPDPVIRTGADDRTNNMKSEMIKGQSDLSVVSPSSDSGVHSVDEQWDCMSTYSGESDSIQSVKTVYAGVACQTDSPVVKLRNMESRGVINPLKGQHGDHNSMPSLSTNGHNSDIADMEDFSDEEEEQWEEVEPSEDVQTEVRTDGVGNNASNSRERSELPKKPTVVTPHDMEIHDEDYWTKFRLLAKQAFKLDNVALAASDYPVAVKELVVRSRVTMQDINDRADRWYVEQQELEAAGETVESSFFYSDTDRLEDFTIPISDWCHKRSPIVHEEATKTAFGSVENAEEIEEMFKLTDNVGMCSDPDARAKFELSPDKIDVCSEPDTRAKFELSPNKIDVCPDPDARAKVELSPTLEDGVDVCSEPDARAKFELSPTLEDGVDVCSEPDARAKFELSPTMEDGVDVCSDPDVRFVHKSDYMSDPGVKPEGQEGCFGGPTIASRQYDSPSEVHGIDRPVNAERSVYTSTGPLGFRVTLGGHITDWPDPVEPPGTMKQVIFPRPTADREGCISADSVHPAVTLFSAQPVAAGLSDPIAVRRSVDVHDTVGLEVGGPVGRVPYSELRQTDVGSILHSNRRDDVIASRSGTTEHPDDRSGDIDCADTTYVESDKFAGEWDPLVEKDNGCQLVRVNGGLDNCLTNLRDVSGSSDSGVQSWTEQWDNMSDNLMDDSYVDTGDLHRSVSNELARLLFDAPPNTEDEDASGSPGTDGSVTGVLPRCQPEAMFDDDRNLSCNDMTDNEYDSNSDLEGYSDFSDDSSVLGIRKVLRRRVPYRGRAPSPRKGCARAPRTSPVPPRNRAEQLQLEHNSIRSSWNRWSYGNVVDYMDEEFVPGICTLTDARLEEGADPRLDRYFPKLVQSLARAGRVVRKVPRCQENHRMRRDLMLRLFDEEMEKSDLACDRFPDREAGLVARLVACTTAAWGAPPEVRETFTPPIRRCRRRKSAALRECLSDVEDYFENAAEEELWTNRAIAWYQPCL